MSGIALSKLQSRKPYIAAQGMLLCVVKGNASSEEAAAIVRLSKADGIDFRVAGRRLRDWIVAAMDVLGIQTCKEPEGSDAYELIDLLRDPAWLDGMESILVK